MKPVQLSLTQASAELIIRALIEMPFKQVNQLIHYIDHEIAVSQQSAELIVRALIEMPFKQVNQLIHYIDHEIAVSQQMPTNTVTVATAQTYKWGLKKDGTPKKAPGRPHRKVTK